MDSKWLGLQMLERASPVLGPMTVPWRYSMPSHAKADPSTLSHIMPHPLSAAGKAKKTLSVGMPTASGTSSPALIWDHLESPHVVGCNNWLLQLQWLSTCGVHKGAGQCSVSLYRVCFRHLAEHLGTPHPGNQGQGHHLSECAQFLMFLRKLCL